MLASSVVQGMVASAQPTPHVMPPPKVTHAALFDQHWNGKKFEGGGFVMSMYGDVMCCGMQQLGQFGVLSPDLKDKQINWDSWIFAVNKHKISGQCIVSSIILQPANGQWAAKSFLEAWGAVKVTEFVNPNTKRLLGIYHKVH